MFVSVLIVLIMVSVWNFIKLTFLCLHICMVNTLSNKQQQQLVGIKQYCHMHTFVVTATWYMLWLYVLHTLPID